MYSPIGMPAWTCIANDLVVHVGNVHHVLDADPGQLEEAAQHVDLQKSTKIADVAVIVDRRPAGVHAQGVAVRGDEFIHLSRKGIEETEGHGSGVGLLVQKAFKDYLNCAFSIVAAGVMGWLRAAWRNTESCGSVW